MYSKLQGVVLSPTRTTIHCQPFPPKRYNMSLANLMQVKLGIQYSVVVSIDPLNCIVSTYQILSVLPGGHI